MVKLNDKRVKWLIDQVVEVGKKPSEVALVYGLSVRMVQQLVKIFKENGRMPEIKSDRRPKVDLTEEQNSNEKRKKYQDSTVETFALYFSYLRS